MFNIFKDMQEKVQARQARIDANPPAAGILPPAQPEVAAPPPPAANIAGIIARQIQRHASARLGAPENGLQAEEEADADEWAVPIAANIGTPAPLVNKPATTNTPEQVVPPIIAAEPAQLAQPPARGELFGLLQGKLQINRQTMGEDDDLLSNAPWETDDEDEKPKYKNNLAKAAPTVVRKKEVRKLDRDTIDGLENMFQAKRPAPPKVVPPAAAIATLPVATPRAAGVGFPMQQRPLQASVVVTPKSHLKVPVPVIAELENEDEKLARELQEQIYNEEKIRLQIEEERNRRLHDRRDTVVRADRLQNAYDSVRGNIMRDDPRHRLQEDADERMAREMHEQFIREDQEREAAQRQAEEQGRIEAARLQQEAQNRVLLARQQNEENDRIFAARLHREEQQAINEQRQQAEERARIEAVRLQAEERARIEAARLQAEIERAAFIEAEAKRVEDARQAQIAHNAEVARLTAEAQEAAFRRNEVAEQQRLRDAAEAAARARNGQ